MNTLPANRNDSRLEVDEQHVRVVLLREAGVTWDRISRLTGLSATWCRKIWRKHLEQAFEQMDVHQHRARIFATLEEIYDALRPFVLGEPIPEDAVHPDKHDTDMLLKVLRAQADLIGANAPRQTHPQLQVQTVNDGPQPAFNAQATARAERTKALVQFLHAHGLDGQPPRHVAPYDEEEPQSEHRGL
jgi:hypothetical protein